jgi:hypothetical protein
MFCLALVPFILICIDECRKKGGPNGLLGLGHLALLNLRRASATPGQRNPRKPLQDAHRSLLGANERLARQLLNGACPSH